MRAHGPKPKTNGDLNHHPQPLVPLSSPISWLYALSCHSSLAPGPWTAAVGALASSTRPRAGRGLAATRARRRERQRPRGRAGVDQQARSGLVWIGPRQMQGGQAAMHTQVRFVRAAAAWRSQSPGRGSTYDQRRIEHARAENRARSRGGPPLGGWAGLNGGRGARVGSLASFTGDHTLWSRAARVCLPTTLPSRPLRARGPWPPAFPSRPGRGVPGGRQGCLSAYRRRPGVGQRLVRPRRPSAILSERCWAPISLTKIIDGHT